MIVMKSDGQVIAGIKRVMAQHPELTYSGFGLSSGPRRTPEDRKAQFEKERQDMLTPQAVDEFRRATTWLERQPRTKNLNRQAGTSYGLKQEVEAESGGHVSNGMFIAAAAACGYLVKQASHGSLNAWLNIGQMRPSNPNLHLVTPKQDPNAPRSTRR